MFSIINDAARAYQGIIPADRWHEPYMPMAELEAQLAEGIAFSGYESDGELAGVMGIQDKGDVVLIRHAYVRTSERRKGIGEKLLKHLEASARKPVPASRIRRERSCTTSRQVVLPPMRANSGPEVAMDPRTPQKVIFM